MKKINTYVVIIMLIIVGLFVYSQEKPKEQEPVKKESKKKEISKEDMMKAYKELEKQNKKMDSVIIKTKKDTIK